MCYNNSHRRRLLSTLLSYKYIKQKKHRFQAVFFRNKKAELYLLLFILIYVLYIEINGAYRGCYRNSISCLMA